MRNPPSSRAAARDPRRQHPPGFALVVTISLMVLLTILAVALLGLSTISLRASTRDSENAEARANARLALMLALAQLQKQTGPDQRVTTTADQLSAGNGGETSAAAGRRHWTGVYRSWTDGQPSRPEPDFLEWLVSGDENDVESLEFAKSAGGGSDLVELVGEGSVGDAREGAVEVPSFTVKSRSGGNARLAWWVGDQNVKAALASPPSEEVGSLAMRRLALQGAPRNAVEWASADGEQPFRQADLDDPRVALITDWKQSALLAGDIDSPRPLFHDLTAFSTGLLTNVRAGGFRKDLSMQLERPATVANSRLASNRTALYRVNNENGINLHELWAYYNLYSQLQTRGSYRYTTGGNMPQGTPHLLVANTPNACAADDFFYFKQPVITSYQMVLSFKVQSDTRPRDPNNANIPLAGGRPILWVVSDPVITFWNPLDVPVVVPPSAFFSIKYWQIPYDLMVTVNPGGTRRCPLICSLSGGDGNYLSLVAGNNVQPLVFRPGEVIKVSQTGGMTVNAGRSTNHTLQARAGFNYGNGMAYPVMDLSGSPVEVPANASVRYEARANEFTAGVGAGTGQVPPGYTTHSRHFSTTHHEVYVGFDRKGTGPSLGYGGMYVDYDFGNRRLQLNETRQETQPGTKPAGARFRANRRQEVFRPITSADARTLSAGHLAAEKAPFMIVSYNAKTEAGTDPEARTRYLGRFNPRAHHVDFYDMTQMERDMLPYEYVVDPLNSWRNRAIDTSTTGNAFFGGGMNAELGVSYVSTHSVPREPIVSLAALQHSCANGFEIFRPRDGYAALNAREPMMPHVSHAIGNSVAPAVLSPGQTQGSLPGNRPLADHSYLANLALWDEWFFSGIAPQTVSDFPSRRDQRSVARDFLDGTGTLPVTRYRPDTKGVEVDSVISEMFSGSFPSDRATELAASLIRVDGMFNVNSTSVEAWKALLGGLKGRGVATRSIDGAESTVGGDEDEIPVAGLMGPHEAVAKGGNVQEEAQWIGRRVLTEDEIDQLAEAIVREVRRRGPFLSLADFVNRRPGNDRDLARAGAIQNALDSGEVDINADWQTSGRGVSNSVAGRFAFPDAEEGPSGYGMPGIVKQADILTPIAPLLSARSDTFLVRAYGESVDATGRVLARAWCEAVVERDKNFLDLEDPADRALTALRSDANKTFGRRYNIVSFRWLQADEV